MSCFSGEQDEVSRLFKIRRTVMQMLRDRGYEVDEETDINMSRTQFLEQFQFHGGKREELFIHKAKAPPDPANEDYEDRLRDPSSDQACLYFFFFSFL
ncbi:hypothetical protein IFM89_037852 [Coptis chinensis]|uniref:RNA polymerase Rpb5 N-terminal domain-containing protein n=1 Tax=Coptis chinensis TaxID=261450 RepID=A0A835HQ71_9MAGN|nr:hypothetical protein IFM89_037852 [Coptis chinensis]